LAVAKGWRRYIDVLAVAALALCVFSGSNAAPTQGNSPLVQLVPRAEIDHCPTVKEAIALSLVNKEQLKNRALRLECGNKIEEKSS
jgi:hypothetical protein